MKTLASALALSVLAACGTELAEDSIDQDMNAAAAGIAEGSAKACAILRVANELSAADLDKKVRLDSRAAKNIALRRSGEDGALGTDDDVWFKDLKALDAVAYVGPKTLERMLDYTRGVRDFDCGVVDVQVLAFNDFHGNLKPPSGSSGKIVTGPNGATDFVLAGGAEFMATHLKALKAKNPDTLVVTAGDIVGASPLLSALFHDEPTIEAMHGFGLSVASVGNHEFDEGVDELLRLQNGGCHPVDGCQDDDGFAGASFPYLAANVLNAQGKTVLPPFQVRYVKGAKIAFIGLTLKGTPLVTSPEGTKGLTFLDEAETINALVPKIKALGVETMVALIHEGGAQTGLYNECAGVSGPIFEIAKKLDPAVSVIISGHTNAAHVCSIDGRLITSAASFGRLITDIDLRIEARSGKLVGVAAENVIVTQTVEKDAAQSKLIGKYDKIALPLAERKVGAITGDLLKPATTDVPESPLGNLIADSQLAATRASGAQIAFMNPGGIRTDLVFAAAKATYPNDADGSVNYGEAFAVQPFGNTLLTMTVTGDQLHTLLEQQWSVANGVEKANMLAVSEGFTYSFDATKPLGSRVAPAGIKLAGKVVDPAATYRITVNAFIGAGGDGFAILKQGTNLVGGGIDLDAFMAWFKAHPSVSPPALGRVVRN